MDFFSRLGQKAADVCTSVVGSWPFIILYNLLVVGWLMWNIVFHEDTLALNLFLSWLAGVQAPVIMISQNRQEQIQRKQDKYMLHIMEAVKAMLEDNNNKR